MENESPYNEWIIQALYDLETAEALYNSERFIHAVFIVHLAIEKAIKGVYHSREGKPPPKTHDLAYLTELSELNVSEEFWELIYSLIDTHLLTRYPVELEVVLRKYNDEVVRDIIDKTKEFIRWIEQQQ